MAASLQTNVTSCLLLSQILSSGMPHPTYGKSTLRVVKSMKPFENSPTKKSCGPTWTCVRFALLAKNLRRSASRCNGSGVLGEQSSSGRSPDQGGSEPAAQGLRAHQPELAAYALTHLMCR